MLQIFIRSQKLFKIFWIRFPLNFIKIFFLFLISLLVRQKKKKLIKEGKSFRIGRLIKIWQLCRHLQRNKRNSFDFKCADSSELFFFGLKLASVSFLSVSTWKATSLLRRQAQVAQVKDSNELEKREWERNESGESEWESCHRLQTKFDWLKREKNCF